MKLIHFKQNCYTKLDEYQPESPIWLMTELSELKL